MAETKNLLTREFCKSEYKKQYKDKMRYCTGAYLILFFLGILGALLCIPLMKAFFLIGVLYFIPFACAVFVVIWQTIFEILIIKKLDRGEFSIVKDEVHRKSEGEVPDFFLMRFSIFTIRNRVQDVLYFKKYGRYRPSDTVFACTDQGDTFYLMVLDDRKKTVLMVYHSDMYEYKEN